MFNVIRIKKILKYTYNKIFNKKLDFFKKTAKIDAVKGVFV